MPPTTGTPSLPANAFADEIKSKSSISPLLKKRLFFIRVLIEIIQPHRNKMGNN
jgi:hypothetical protein